MQPSWRKVKLMFIPKPRKANYTQSKAYCPINLLSFMLKVKEKLVQRHIRDKILRFNPLHENQSAYQALKLHYTEWSNIQRKQ
jgi:hypothetical protein